MVSVEHKQGQNPFRTMDWFLLSIILVLHAIGLFVLRSVAIQKGDPGMFSRQLVAAMIGLACLIILLFIDYKDFRILGFAAYAATTGLLVLVLFYGHGLEEVGMSGWLMLGPVSFQPSELAKITMVLVGAFFFERVREKGTILNYLMLAGFTLLPIVLILMQPDFGTAMVCIFVLVCMLFVWGFKYRYIVITLAVLSASAIPVWVYVMPKVLDDYQMKRLLSFVNPTAYSKDAAYQVRMAIRAIGSGQDKVDMTRDYAANWVPASHTDMIFAALGEKLGFYGAALTVLLFAFLLLRCIYVAAFARDRFGAYVIIGLFAVFFAHFLENVGMNLGLMPVTGIPLPFISSGGSSLVANDIAAGILIGVSMRRKTVPYET
jgi:rod shape determining protein RodA